MRIEQLYYFIDLGKTLSITQTAENYFISQQALSESFKKLEAEFSLKLFQRTRHGIILTEEGIAFLNTANKIIALYETALRKENSEIRITDQPITIAIHPRIFPFLTSTIIDNFSHLYPSILLKFVEQDNENIFSLIANNAVDFGLTATEKAIYDAKPLAIQNALGEYITINLDLLLLSDNVYCTTHEKGDDFSPLETSTTSPCVCYERSMNLLSSFDESLSFSNHSSNLYISSNPLIHKKLLLAGLADEMISRIEYEKYYKSIPNIYAYSIPKINTCFCIAHSSKKNLDQSSYLFYNFIKKNLSFRS